MGTEESHDRMQTALEDLWMYTGELFSKDEIDELLIGRKISPDPNLLKPEWDEMVSKVLEESTLKLPDNDRFRAGGGSEGGSYGTPRTYTCRDANRQQILPGSEVIASDIQPMRWRYNFLL